MSKLTYSGSECVCEAPTPVEEKQPISLVLHHNTETADRIAELASRLCGEVNGEKISPKSSMAIECMRDEIRYQTYMLESAENILERLLVMLGG